ncbi:MAG TPA: hypothetical protein VGK03_03445 [Geothrix sp.]|jgi:hypothetical protein
MSEKSTSTTGFDQQLINTLRPDPAPDDLRRSLLRTAKGSDTRRTTHQTWQAFGIAATIMLMLGSGAWGWFSHWNSHEGERFTRAALQTYMEVRSMDFSVDDTAQESVEQCMERCRRWSIESVGFTAHLPKDFANQPLRGGRACTMASCRAACFYLKDGRAVYVFDRTLQGLDTDSKKRPLILATGHRGTAWNEDGQGYIVVEPPGWKSGG